MEDGEPDTEKPVTIFSRNYVAFSVLHDVIWMIVWPVVLVVQQVGSFWWWWALIALPLTGVYLTWHSVTLIRIDKQEKRTGGEGWPPW
ncbi:MAG TPA: hypothetical protein VNT92_03905 [Acidimicrobiia bacterium]|nr:hypothetical protein [Acidimicrobiia bacterium]